jgi:hypothetical protein
MTAMHTDRRNRCDQIIDVIDRCLAECERTAIDPAHDAPKGDTQ